MKKFYKFVSVRELNDHYEILLDDKTLKASSGSALGFPCEGLAYLVAKEWQDQEEEIDPQTMPVMHIISTAQEQVKRDRVTMQEKICAYFDTDLLCYHTELPINLSNKQDEVWGRWLSWFEKEFQYKPKITKSLLALKQDEAAHQVVQGYVRSLSDIEFTVLQMLTTLTGSIILAIAFVKKAADEDEVFKAACLEDHYKAEIYNEEKHGLAPLEEKKQNSMISDLKAAKQVLDALVV